MAATTATTTRTYAASNHGDFTKGAAYNDTALPCHSQGCDVAIEGVKALPQEYTRLPRQEEA